MQILNNFETLWLPLFLLLLFLYGSRSDEELPDIKYSIAKSLICFQCVTSNVEKAPLCSISFFKLTTPAEKLNLTFQCPPNRQDFCYTQVEIISGVTKTSRGCYGSKDKYQSSIKVGCSTSNDDKKTLCFCKDHLCNNSANIFVKFYFVSLLLFIYLALQVTF